MVSRCGEYVKPSTPWIYYKRNEKGPILMLVFVVFVKEPFSTQVRTPTPAKEARCSTPGFLNYNVRCIALSSHITTSSIEASGSIR